MTAQHSPKQNHILAVVPTEVYERLLPGLELVRTELDQVLYESGGAQDYIYFPASGVVSLLSVMENGNSAEIAMVGNDGAVGIPIFMGGNTTPSRAVVQIAGYAYRLEARLLKKEFERGGPLQIIFSRYTQALIARMMQTAVCNRHHSIEQQLCRWLLLSLDHLSSSELVMTQELIADMPGVRLEGVTEAAGKLQSEGLISYGRGHIKVLDRKKLEARVCECYVVIKKESDRVLLYRPRATTTTAERS